jgi:hypothetical protein
VKLGADRQESTGEREVVSFTDAPSIADIWASGPCVSDRTSEASEHPVPDKRRPTPTSPSVIGSVRGRL